MRHPSKSLQRKCGTRQFRRFENEFQHFENELLFLSTNFFIFSKDNLDLCLKTVDFCSFSKNFVDRNGIKRVTLLKFLSNIHNEI